MQQDRNRLRQQIIQRRLMRHAEIAQRVVIHRDAAAHPAIRVMAVTEAIDFARTADAVHRGVEPQRDQNLRINSGPAGPPLARPDRRVERRQIQPLDKAPHQAGRVAAATGPRDYTAAARSGFGWPFRSARACRRPSPAWRPSTSANKASLIRHSLVDPDRHARLFTITCRVSSQALSPEP